MTEQGPTLWANWRAAMAGATSRGAYEAALHSDAHVTGEVLEGLGPYKLFNPIDTRPLAGVLGVGVVLRVEHHLPEFIASPDDMARTSTTHYVGLAPASDHIACLLSLVFGVRFRSGGEIRTFAPDGDPRGRPLFATHHSPTRTAPQGGSVIPSATGRTVLLDDSVEWIGRLPALDADGATQVLRAARLYRQALWVADDDPELAWLLLISAGEVGATDWAQRQGAPASRLQDTLPDLTDVLAASGGDELVAKVAPLVAHLTRATGRFVDFICNFASEPPPDRPEDEWAQVDWSKLKRIAARVYECRSNVLHAGHPIPGPMLEVPWQGDMTHPAERPLGLGAAHGATTWAARDLPINLSALAEIIRRAVLAWWKQLADERAVDVKG